MVLLTSKLIKFVLLILAMVVGYRMFRKRFSTFGQLALLGMVVAFASIANAVAGMLPPLHDTIIITALGEKNEAAKSEAVYLEGFTVDGKDIAIENPVKGTWLWNGDIYAWLPDSAAQRPKETTDSIVLAVPVGWNRTVNFRGNVWKGMVGVTSGETTWTVDTYSEESWAKISTEIGRSKSSDLIWNQIRCLFIYAIILFAACAFGFCIAKGDKLTGDKVNNFIANHWDTISIGGVALGVGYFLWNTYPTYYNFSRDQFVILGLITHEEKLTDILKYYASTKCAEPPLISILLFFYLKIAPFGKGWLFLQPTLYVVGTLFLAGKYVSKYTGKITGVTATILMASSATILQYGKELRSYSIVILVSLVLVSAYTNIRLNGVSKKRQFQFIASMVLTAYSCYHGIVLLLGIFIFDLAWNIKRLRWKIFVPYLIAGICYLPWVVIVGANLLRHIDSWDGVATWHFALNFENIKAIIYQLCGKNVFLVLLFAGSTVLLACRIIRKKELLREYLIWTLCTYLVLFFCVVVLGWALLHPTNTLLQYRYFAPIFALSSLAECGLLHWVIEYLSSKQNSTCGVVIPLTLCGFLLFRSAYVVINEQCSWENLDSHSYYNVAKAVLSDSEIYYQTSCVYVGKSDSARYELSWAYDYMMEQNGRRPPVNWVYNIEEAKQYNKVFCVQGLLSEEQKVLQDQGFHMSHSQWNLSIFEKG